MLLLPLLLLQLLLLLLNLLLLCGRQVLQLHRRVESHRMVERVRGTIDRDGERERRRG